MFRSKLSRMEKRRQFIGILFVFPSFVGVMIFYFVPFLDVIRRSFLQASGEYFCGLENYINVWSNEAFQLAAVNTIRFVAVCLPLLLIISLILALLLTSFGQKLKKSRFCKNNTKKKAGILGAVKGIYLIPFAIPAASVVLLWKLLFDNHGFINAIIHTWGVPPIDWMNTDAAFAVLVFSYIWKNLGYTLILWMAGLATVPKSVYEAAQIDGAGRRTQFFKITLPLIKPIIFTIVILSFLNSFKVFREAYLVAGNYPQKNIYLLQHLFNNWFLDLSVDKMAAGAVTLVFVIAIFVKLLQKCWDA